MKRFFGLLVVLALFCGCDDGDMDVDSFDFTTVNADKCGEGKEDFFIFKTSGNEALIIQIDEATFKPAVTPSGTTQNVTINGTSVKVIYRLYSGAITKNELCTTIPPQSPIVQEEWNATGGTLEIVTSATRNINEDTGSNLITGFSHTITFKNIRFDVGDGKTATYETLSFGAYNTTIEATANFSDLEIKTCDGQPVLFKYSNTQALTMTFSPAVFQTLFANTPTSGTPRTQLINAESAISYRVFSSTLSQNAFCNATLPPVRDKQLWNAQPGVSGISGIIEVTTTTLGDNFEHTVRLKNVTFQNPDDAGQNFTFGTDYEFGKFVTAGN